MTLSLPPDYGSHAGVSLKVNFQELVDKNPGNCSLREYQYLGGLIWCNKPCNLLIFSIGNDSPYWIKLNSGGNTLFLEDSAKWIQHIKGEIPKIQIEKVKYTTKRRHWRRIIDRPKKLQMVLPEEVQNTFWDIIFIDGPRGYNDKKPGRMQSIYSSSLLNYRHILLHDCDREVENVYFRKYIGEPTYTIDKLFHKERF